MSIFPFFEQLKKKKKSSAILAPLLFFHMKRTSWSFLLLHCTISLTLVSLIHQNRRAEAESKNNIHFTKSRKLTLGVKIVHKIGIFSVDGFT